MDERIRINNIDYKITPCPQSDWTDAVLVTSENWKRIYETREYKLKKKIFEKRYKPMTITEVGR